MSKEIKHKKITMRHSTSEKSAALEKLIIEDDQLTDYYSNSSYSKRSSIKSNNYTITYDDSLDNQLKKAENKENCNGHVLIKEEFKTKRIKASIIKIINRQENYWSEKEMEMFAMIHGGIMFDTTVEKALKCQADLSFIETKKFNSYKKIALLRRQKQFDYSNKINFIKEKYNVQLNHSQLHNLRTLCLNDNIIFEILERNKSIINNFMHFFDQSNEPKIKYKSIESDFNKKSRQTA
jgi:hypothetical protein